MYLLQACVTLAAQITGEQRCKAVYLPHSTNHSSLAQLDTMCQAGWHRSPYACSLGLFRPGNDSSPKQPLRHAPELAATAKP